MKKLFLTFAALLLVCGMAKAQSFKVVEGDLSFLKDVTELQAELTWDGTMIGEMTETEYVDSKKDNKADFDEFKRRWFEDDRNVSLATLTNSFGNSLGKRSRVTLDSTARYKFVFNVDKIDLGFAGVGLVSKGTLLWATVYVVDAQSGKTLATIKVDESKSSTSYDMKVTKLLAFDKLGNTTAKWLVKQKYVSKK